MNSRKTWSVVRQDSSAPNNLRLVQTSLVDHGAQAFGIRDEWLRPLLIWDEELGVVPGAVPAPVRWPGPLPPVGGLRLDVRGVEPLLAGRFWQPIQELRGRVTTRGVRRAIAHLSGWSEPEIGQWAETAALLARRIWESLRTRSDFALDVAPFGFHAIGSVLGRGEEECEAVIREASEWSPKWMSSDECQTVLWLATLALCRRRDVSDVFVYTSFTDEENWISALSRASDVGEFDGAAPPVGTGSDEEVMALAEQFPDDPDALIAAFAHQTLEANGRHGRAVHDTSRQGSVRTQVVHALVDFEGYVKSRVVVANLPDIPSARDAGARKAVTAYGGDAIEITAISHDLPEGFSQLPHAGREVSFL